MAEVSSSVRSYKLSLLIMVLPYVFIYIVGYYLFQYLTPSNLNVLYPIQNDLIRLLIVDLVGTVAIFIVSILFQNSSIYDPYWMVPTFGLVLYLNEVSPFKNSVTNWIIMGPILCYCIKHTTYYFRFWPGLKYEDFRYVEFSKKITNKVIYWIFSFVGLHIVPTLMVFFAIIPAYNSLRIPLEEYTNTLQGTVLLYGGVLLSWTGLIVETIADEQILPWRSKKSKEIIFTGLWKYSRHPNYFGDMLIWIGMVLPTLVDTTVPIAQNALGAVVILLVMNIYTLPAMEKHLKQSRPQYTEYQANVSRMIPWFNSYNPKKQK